MYTYVYVCRCVYIYIYIISFGLVVAFAKRMRSALSFRLTASCQDMVMSVAFLTVSALLCPDLPTESSKTGQSTLVLHEASPLADQFLKHDPKDDESQRSPIPFGELIVE